MKTKLIRNKISDCIASNHFVSCYECCDELTCELKRKLKEKLNKNIKK